MSFLDRSEIIRLISADRVSETEMRLLVSQYILDRKRVKVDVRPLKSHFFSLPLHLRDKLAMRQLEMLNAAFNHSIKYYAELFKP
jgi:hypothetical protein